MPGYKEVFFSFLLALGVLLVFMIMVGILEFRSRRVWEEKISFLEDVDHRMEPGIEGNNSDGIRCSKEPDAFAPEHLNIIFLGDSFVYGGKVAARYAFPQRFERMANACCNPGVTVNVANFGWVSSSPYLSLQLLKDIAAKYNPDVVFLCIDMTDFFDDLKYQSLKERPKFIFKMLSWLPGSFYSVQSVLYRLRGTPLGKLYEFVFGLPNDRFFVVNKPLEQTKHYCEKMVSNINKINEFVTTTLGARFVLVILPRSFQYSDRESPDSWEKDQYEVLGPYVYEPFTFFDELREKVSYPIYSMLDDFRFSGVFPTCLPSDPHWNAYGHGIAARSVFAIAEKENLFRGAMPDGEDNCPIVRNKGKRHTDSKGTGEACGNKVAHYWWEAEDSDALVMPFVVAYDENASGGKYVYTPNGSGSQHVPGSSMVSYTINVPRTGEYVLWGRVKVSSYKDNSFFVQADDDLDNLWDLVPGNYWHWDKVRNRGSDDPVYFILARGSHTLKIKMREDGTQLDTMLLTNDLSLVPGSVEALHKKRALAG